MPCCMRAVPHLKVVLSFSIESSTSNVTLLSLGCRGLSLKVSDPRCLPLVSHRYTVCLVVLNICAMLVTVKSVLASFLKAPLMPGESLTTRSEEHTSELQSLAYLVCRLLL